MKEIRYTLKDELGLHARPAGLLVKSLSNWQSEVSMVTPSKTVNARRLMAVMSLALKQGQELVMTFSGPDEDDAANAALAFIKANL